VESNERRELIDDLLAALESTGRTLDASQLLELARVERELSHALATIRRLIDMIVGAG
jgi:hypothetical protein